MFFWKLVSKVCFLFCNYMNLYVKSNPFFVLCTAKNSLDRKGSCCHCKARLQSMISWIYFLVKWINWLQWTLLLHKIKKENKLQKKKKKHEKHKVNNKKSLENALLGMSMNVDKQTSQAVISKSCKKCYLFSSGDWYRALE